MTLPTLPQGGAAVMSEMTLLDKAAGELGKMLLFVTPFDELREEQKDRLRAQVLAVARVILSAPASEGMIEAAAKLSGEDGMRHAAIMGLLRRDYAAMSSALLSELSVER